MGDFDKARYIAGRYSEYLLSESFTMMPYRGAYSEIPYGLVGACARKILLVMNYQMIRQGILPGTIEDSIPLPSGKVIWDGHCDLECALYRQITGCLETLGWEFDIYDYASDFYGEAALSEIEAYLRLQEMEEELISAVLRQESVTDSSAGYIQGSVMLYTNPFLSKYLREETENLHYAEVVGLADFFSTLNIYNMASEPMLWYGDDLYFISIQPCVYAEEYGRRIDLGDYYLDPQAPYIGVMLDKLIRT